LEKKGDSGEPVRKSGKVKQFEQKSGRGYTRKRPRENKEKRHSDYQEKGVQGGGCLGRVWNVPTKRIQTVTIRGKPRVERKRGQGGTTKKKL